MILGFGVCGSDSSDPRFQPGTYLHEQGAQELMYQLCRHPVGTASVDKSLLDGLLRIGAVRVSEGRCFLNCACFLRDDIALLNEQGAAFGMSLARSIERPINTVPLRSLRFATRADDFPKYLFFLVGCVVLNWHGLALLAGKGYTLRESETVRPGGGNYTVFMNERFEHSLRELYWGSHDWPCDDYCLTSFGDHESSRRQCLPDLAWEMLAAPPSGESAVLVATRDEAVRCYALAVARHMLGEQVGDKKLQAHLEAVHYTVGGKPAVPVLVAEDMAVLHPWIRELDKVLMRWIDAHNDEMRRSLSRLAPLQQGVGWREILLQVWHYVFGHANRCLCARGTLFDPYCVDSSFPGYLPAVYRRQCNLRAIRTD